jgi:polar amino acid transport system ATP-binding protein
MSREHKAAEMIRAEALRKSFGRLEVLKGVDLTVRQGEIISIIGPSGSGKSTLLRCLIHLEKVSSGSIFIEGEPIVTTDAGLAVRSPHEREVRHRCRKLGMVFQNFNLFPHKTALQNVTEALIVVAKMDKAQAVVRGEQMLAKVGLSDKRDTYPSYLS